MNYFVSVLLHTLHYLIILCDIFVGDAGPTLRAHLIPVARAGGKATPRSKRVHRNREFQLAEDPVTATLLWRQPSRIH